MECLPGLKTFLEDRFILSLAEVLFANELFIERREMVFEDGNTPHREMFPKDVQFPLGVEAEKTSSLQSSFSVGHCNILQTKIFQPVLAFFTSE